MTNISTDNNTIFVRSIGMDNRKEAVFRMAFKMFTKRQYCLLEPGDTRVAALTIIDIDGPDGTVISEKLHQSTPEQRILVTTVSPPPDSVFPILQKPVRMETLFPALEALLLKPQNTPEKIITKVTPIRPEITLPSSDNRARPAPSDATPTESPSSAQVTASAPVKPAPILRPETVQYFNPQEGLLGLLQVAQRDRSPAVIVDVDQQIILRLDPATDQALLLIDNERLKVLARSAQPVLQMRAPRENDPQPDSNVRHLSLQELLWQVGAWTANGRLGQHLQVQAPVQLKQWPNLTRLCMLPDALRLAAFLARSPASPALTVKMLRVEPYDLFNFIAAADSLGLLRYNTLENPESIIRTDGNSTSTQIEVPTAKRSFLGRLLKRIAGL
ncbi:MAG: response regulator [Acidithiobacillus sp.]